MNKVYIIKYSSVFVKDYVVIEKEINETIIKEELSKIAVLAIDTEISELYFLNTNEHFNNDILVDILDVTDSDNVVVFNSYLLSFTDKYNNLLYTLPARDKTIYCF